VSGETYSETLIRQAMKRYFGESRAWKEGVAFAIHMVVVHHGIDDCVVGCECFRDTDYCTHFDELIDGTAEPEQTELEPEGDLVYVHDHGAFSSDCNSRCGWYRAKRAEVGR